MLSLVLCILIVPSDISADTWHVPSQCLTIQAGIDSASAGDIVLIACGTYFEHEIIMKSGVTLRSQTGQPDCVTIDAGGNGRVIVCRLMEAGTVLEGLTITGGYIGGDKISGAGICCDSSTVTVHRCTMTGNWAESDGAGMRCKYATSATLRDCIFHDNHTDIYGGGLTVNEGSTVMLERCTFSENSAYAWGGGLYVARASFCSINDCTFYRNTAVQGGAFECRNLGTSVDATGCLFLENATTSYSGGAILADAPITITDCVFQENYSPGGVLGEGGAVSCHNTGTFTNCTFIGNIAELNGGALYAGRTNPGVHTATVTNCSFIENEADRGGGIWAGNVNVHASGCTFYGNGASDRGSGVFSSDDTILENCIIAGGCQSQAVYRYGSGTATLTCCDIHGNAGGDWVDCIAGQLGVNGNFSAYPWFCNPPGRDFGLCEESPCLPGNHPDGYECGLIGRFGLGCTCGPISTESKSWGALKSMVR
jgi:predicted outer membrane repeat protein